MSAPDPFDTAAIRAAVLAAWTGSQTRFREDANAEEDLVLGGYRDRLVVELIQNALDAAAPAAGKVRVDIGTDALLVANTGRPLTAEGVQALVSLRASSKRDESGAIGKFGVGFASVLAVTDTPAIVSSTGGIGFSLGRTRSLVGSIPGLGAELIRRDGGVPVLRLPFPLTEVPVDVHALLDAGWSTVVRLPYRDAEARALSMTLVRQLDPVLPVVLDGFGSLELVLPDEPPRYVERRETGDGDLEVDGVRWRVVRRSGQLDDGVRDDRSVEDRGSQWWAHAAVPIDADGVPQPLPDRVRRVARAPQETHEELTIPIVLSASLPLDSDRRRVRPGAVGDRVAHELAAAVVELMERVTPGRGMLDLVARGLPASELDSTIRAEVERLLPASQVLPDGARMLLDLGHATQPVAALIAEVSAGFLPGDWPPTHPAYDALGVTRLDTRRFVEWLVESGLRPAPQWWGRLAEALSDASDGDAITGLPVPLVDGSFAIGTRGVLLPESGLDVGGLLGAGVSLRLLHPDAAAAAWHRMGVQSATAATLLGDDRVRAAVEDEADALREDGIEPSGQLGRAILGLIAGSAISIAELPWLQDVLLMAADGSYWPARDLLLPSSPLREVVEDPVVVADELVGDHFEALLALGVADRFVVEQHDTGSEIRDLDLIRDDAWPRALELIAEDPDARAAVLQGRDAVDQLHELVIIDGRPLEDFVAATDHVLAALFDPLPAHLDDAFLAALRLPRSLEDLDGDQVWDALDRIGLAETALDRDGVRRAYSVLASRAGEGDPPISVRAVVNGELAAVPTKDVVIVDAPDLVELIGSRPYVPVALSAAHALAALLDAPLASELATYEVISASVTAHVSGATYEQHEQLLVLDADGEQREVQWRLIDGQIHASSLDGVGRAMALRDGRWGEREAYVARLRSTRPDSAGDFDEVEQSGR